MTQSNGFRWTNESVLRFAGGGNPVATIERKARELVLKARDAGWQGPPFNPLFLADFLGIPVEASANVPDARTVSATTGLRIQFNPTQPRERVRFSIAHELAHVLFPDVARRTRHRGGDSAVHDDWQLEALCNLAAAEFVMPIGSLPVRSNVPSIEDLMVERRRFDVSAEAFLIRAVKIADEPVAMFCASAASDGASKGQYRVDYLVSSPSAPALKLQGSPVPLDSAIYRCTAIGHTDHARETWFANKALPIECVGLPSPSGSIYPRVAGLVRFSKRANSSSDIRFLQGNVLQPKGSGPKIICQLVNDQARRWGGGVAKISARTFPDAHQSFGRWITGVPKRERLGQVHLASVDDSTSLASFVAQEGYGPAPGPRIRYTALERCLEKTAEVAKSHSASIHMPRIGAGQSGGQWDIVEELVRNILIRTGVAVTVYDLPPRRPRASLFD